MQTLSGGIAQVGRKRSVRSNAGMFGAIWLRVRRCPPIRSANAGGGPDRSRIEDLPRGQTRSPVPPDRRSPARNRAPAQCRRGHGSLLVPRNGRGQTVLGLRSRRRYSPRDDGAIWRGGCPSPPEHADSSFTPESRMRITYRQDGVRTSPHADQLRGELGRFIALRIVARIMQTGSRQKYRPEHRAA